MEENLAIANVTKAILMQGMENNTETTTQLQITKTPLLELDQEAFQFFTQHYMTTAKRKTQKTTVKLQAKRQKFHVLNDLSTNAFENNFHMTKTTYEKLFRCIQEPLAAVELTTFANVKQICAVSFYKLANGTDYSALAERFHLTPEYCARIVRNFCTAIAERFMPWPNSYQTQAQTLTTFSYDIKNRFPGLFGVVKLKSLNVLLGKQNTVQPIVLQLICKGNKHIIDCCVELEQQYSFDNTPIGQMLAISKKTLPFNSYLVGDTCCPLKKYLIRPFADQELSAAQQLFNDSFRLPLSIGEEVYYLLSKRFNILQSLRAAHLTELRSIVETICSLHNLCIDSNDNCRNNTPSLMQHIELVGSETDVEGQAARLALLRSNFN